MECLNQISSQFYRIISFLGLTELEKRYVFALSVLVCSGISLKALKKCIKRSQLKNNRLKKVKERNSSLLTYKKNLDSVSLLYSIFDNCYNYAGL